MDNQRNSDQQRRSAEKEHKQPSAGDQRPSVEGQQSSAESHQPSAESRQLSVGDQPQPADREPIPLRPDDPATMLRGLVAQLMSQTGILSNVAEPTTLPDLSKLKGLQRALGMAQQALDQSPASLRDWSQSAALLSYYSMNDELAQVEAELVTGDHGRLSWRRQVIQPFGTVGLVVTAAGITGQALILPASRRAGSVAARVNVPTPISPELYKYELRITDRPAGAWPSRPIRELVAADATAIVAAIRAWRDATPLQTVETLPLGPADLKPLRALAALRRDLARAAEAGADWAALGLLLGFDPSRPIEIPWPEQPSSTPVDTPQSILVASLLDRLQQAQQAEWGRPTEPTIPGRAPSGHSRPNVISLTPEGQAALAEDLANLDAVRLCSNMPRDGRGQLLLAQEVLLSAYPTAADDSSANRRSAVWLVAQAPQRRRDPQVVTLAIGLIVGGNRRHRWDQARWLWDRRVDADEQARWGVAGLAVSHLGLTGRSKEIERLRTARSAGQLSPAEQVALILLLQDEGAIFEACEVAGVALEPAVAVMASGHAVISGSKEAISWPAALRDALRQAALWRFDALLTMEEKHRAIWATEKRGRKAKPVRLRCLALPNQPQARKTSLMLTRGANGAPQLELESTGNEAILAAVSWQRPHDLDLVRFGLID